MSLKTDSSKSPTYNYFLIKINQNYGDNSINLQEAHKKALDYIKKNYPKAERGNNYWAQEHEVQIPLTDQYFLRYFTFRSCIPPYTDSGLEAFGTRVETCVREEAEVAAKSEAPSCRA